ncbi:hypothetical protein [Sphingomonas sp. PAMC 26621]|uniref:hypothetical protein n=1 Tax=Sphingomonas sp. PAMC 26621 TaxID=1112213 RepID=UPI0011112205|nr:hypothetical protein [Sphingomonas sp. PAMC 26621]
MFEIEHFGLLNDGTKWLAAPSVLKRYPWGEKVKLEVQESYGSARVMAAASQSAIPSDTGRRGDRHFSTAPAVLRIPLLPAPFSKSIEI